MTDWSMVFDGECPEGVRESLCTLGNGYLATRGAAPEHRADGIHYPGTYLAGCYNRLRVEALRVHLALDRIDLLGRSAGAALALWYAARHPDRVDRLVLVMPSPRPVGLEITHLDRQQIAEQRRGQGWFPDAFAAFQRIWSGDTTAADWTAITPFTYGRWDATAQAHVALGASQRNADAAAVYYSAGAIDADATRTALARLQARVLLIAGGYDVSLPPKCAAEYAALFGRAELAVQPGGGHYPWLDDPERFVQTLAVFLN